MENDILLARSGVRWLVGVGGFRFSSKIFKLRISFCAQCVCGLSLSAESGDTCACAESQGRVPTVSRGCESGERECREREPVDENMLISHVHNATE